MFLCVKQVAVEVVPLQLEIEGNLDHDFLCVGGCVITLASHMHRKMAACVRSEFGFPVQPNQENNGHHGHYENNKKQELQGLHVDRKGFTRISSRLNWTRASYGHANDASLIRSDRIGEDSK
jgi:hypothetical protein